MTDLRSERNIERGSKPSPKYAAMIYILEALIFNNYNEIHWEDVSTIEMFKGANRFLLNRIVNDCRETFRYEVSMNQLDTAVGWFWEARDKVLKK